MFMFRSTGRRRRTLICLVAAVAAVAAGMLGLPTQPAIAAPVALRIPDGDYVIENVGSHKVVDVTKASTDKGVPLQLWTSNGSKAQQFRFTRQADGTYEIMNLGSGKYVDVTGGSTIKNAVIQQWTHNGSPAQRWRIERVSTATVRLVNVGSGMRLDVRGNKTDNGTAIQQYPSNDSSAQQWLLASVNPTRDIIRRGPVAFGRDGFMLLAPDCATRRCPGDLVTLAAYPTVPAGFNDRLQWVFEYGASSATWELWTGFFLALAPWGGYTAASTPVSIEPNLAGQGRLALSWYFVAGPKAPYFIFCNMGGTVLDIKGGKIQAGTPLQMWQYNGSAAQQLEIYVIPH